jgi:methylaspartate ammonia-lyase
MPAYKLLSFDDDGAIKAGIEHDGFVFNLASEIVFHGPESALTACRWIRRSDAGVILS